MSVLLVLLTVILMLPAPTLLVASPVPVTRDTLEMGSHVEASVPISTCVYYFNMNNIVRQILMSVLILLIAILMLPVPTLLVASHVPVTRDTLRMGSHVGVSVVIIVHGLYQTH